MFHEAHKEWKGVNVPDVTDSETNIFLEFTVPSGKRLEHHNPVDNFFFSQFISSPITITRIITVSPGSNEALEFKCQ